jgi:hypothetical protein
MYLSGIPTTESGFTIRKTIGSQREELLHCKQNTEMVIQEIESIIRLENLPESATVDFKGGGYGSIELRSDN